MHHSDAVWAASASRLKPSTSPNTARSGHSAIATESIESL